MKKLNRAMCYDDKFFFIFDEKGIGKYYRDKNKSSTPISFHTWDDVEKTSYKLYECNEHCLVLHFSEEEYEIVDHLMYNAHLVEMLSKYVDTTPLVKHKDRKYNYLLISLMLLMLMFGFLYLKFL